MEQREQQIWQRVLGDQTCQQETDLKTLALNSVETVAQLRQFLRSASPKERELLKELVEEEKRNLACIKGLNYLQTGQQIRLLSFPPTEPAQKRQLVKRYHCARRAMAEYTARSAESEWGCVFRDMAQRQERQCALLAQLIGIVGKG